MRQGAGEREQGLGLPYKPLLRSSLEHDWSVWGHVQTTAQLNSGLVIAVINVYISLHALPAKISHTTSTCRIKD